MAEKSMTARKKDLDLLKFEVEELETKIRLHTAKAQWAAIRKANSEALAARKAAKKAS